MPQCDHLFGDTALIALPECIGRDHDQIDFADTACNGALKAAPVQHESDSGLAVRRGQGVDHRLRIRHLRNFFRVDEAGDLDAVQTCRTRPCNKRAFVLGAQKNTLILYTISRRNLDDFHVFWQNWLPAYCNTP